MAPTTGRGQDHERRMNCPPLVNDHALIVHDRRSSGDLALAAILGSMAAAIATRSEDGA
jgi:hypothetical protein